MLSDAKSMPVVAVSDLDRARAFYEGKLGLVSTGPVVEGVIYGTASGGFLVYPSGFAGTNKATVISFQLDWAKFDAEIAALRSAGVELATFDAPDGEWHDGVLEGAGMKSAWFTDPDGNFLNVETTQ
jgi:catechol 2,3-dioxygenase-like lactoylglutathione lyase family enzyme